MPRITVSKSTVIGAPIARVYDAVRDFRQWRSWSPWLICEPECRLEYAADGRSYSWDGEIIGSGTIALTGESVPDTLDHQLTIRKPWKSVSQVRFELAEQDAGTAVTWTMEGSIPFLLFFMTSMMKASIGMDYERGLRMLKDHLETGSVPSKLEFQGRQTAAACRYVSIRTRCPIPEIGPHMDECFGTLGNWLTETSTKPSGAPFSIYHRWDLSRNMTEFSICFPLETDPPGPPEGFITGIRPACEVYAIRHTGPYHHLGNAWSAGYAHARSKRFSPDRKIPPFETYDTDPEKVPEHDAVTTVSFPVR